MNSYTVTMECYRGIAIKIIHPHAHFRFCYYVTFNLDNMPDKKLADSLWIDGEKSAEASHYTYVPYGLSPLGNVEMHGGITFYARHIADNGDRLVEIGCDYNHSWDDGRDYKIEHVIMEARATVDDVINRFFGGNEK